MWGRPGNKYKKINITTLCLLRWCIMPKKDGFTLGKEIKKFKEISPILFWRQKNQKDDIHWRAQIVQMITSPSLFSMEENCFRINAILRRTKNLSEVNQLWRSCTNFGIPFACTTMSKCFRRPKWGSRSLPQRGEWADQRDFSSR